MAALSLWLVTAIAEGCHDGPTESSMRIILVPSETSQIHFPKFHYSTPSSMSSPWSRVTEPAKQLNVFILCLRHLRMFQKVESKISTQETFDMRMVSAMGCWLKEIEQKSNLKTGRSTQTHHVSTIPPCMVIHGRAISPMMCAGKLIFLSEYKHTQGTCMSTFWFF